MIVIICSERTSEHKIMINLNMPASIQVKVYILIFDCLGDKCNIKIKPKLVISLCFYLI